MVEIDGRYWKLELGSKSGTGNGSQVYRGTLMRWTEKQKEVANLASQGKTFNEITAMGYSLNMVSRVTQALKRGESPDKATAKVAAKKLPAGPIPPIDIKGQPIMLDLGTKTVPFDRGKIYDAYQLYSDMMERGIIKDDFASVCLDGIGIIYRLLVLKPVVRGTELLLREETYGRSTGESEAAIGIK